MKRRSFLTSATAVAATAPFGARRAHAKASAPPSVKTPRERSMYLAGFLDELCSLGPRPVGSDACEKAAGIVERELARSCPETRMDTFTFDRWVLDGTPYIAIGGKTIETCPGHGTSGTPPEGVAGTLKRHGENGIGYAIVDAAGTSLAYITTRKERAIPLPYYSFNQKVKCLPIFNVGGYDMPAVDAAAKSGATVRAFSGARFIPNSTATNAIGRLPGDKLGEILVLAHIDTVYNTVGAIDNSADVVQMLMLAHSLALRKRMYGFTFVGTTGEEYDKIGAESVAALLKREGTFDDIRFVLNLDSTHWGPEMMIFTPDEDLFRLFEEADRTVRSYGAPVWRNQNGFVGDGRPFGGCGGKAVYIDTEGDIKGPCWHLPADTPENVPFAFVESSYQVIEEFLLRVQDVL